MNTGEDDKSSNSKSELLRQLKIEKPEPESPGFSGFHLMGAGVVGAIAASLLTWWMIPSADPIIKEVSVASNSSASAKRSSEASAIPSESVSETVAHGEQILNASGYVTARLVATVSAETMGLIKSVEVEEGMKVEQGQVLATLDDAVAQVNLKLAKAQLNAQEARLVSTQADLAEAQRILLRVIKMSSNGFASEAEITQAQTRVDILKSGLITSQADVEVSRMQFAAQQKRLDHHTIRAPFTGVVTVKNAQPGEMVSPSASGGFTRTGICTIVDMDSLEIEVDVNEAFIRKVVPNQPVVANLDAYPNWDIPAKVIAIIPTADRAKATVRVRIKIEEKDERILPDMGVKVALYEENTAI